jgi:hypothetical protein
VHEAARIALEAVRSAPASVERERRRTIDGVQIPVLSLRRIVESKRAAARPKDKAILHALEDALALIDESERPSR